MAVMVAADCAQSSQIDCNTYKALEEVFCAIIECVIHLFYKTAGADIGRVKPYTTVAPTRQEPSWRLLFLLFQHSVLVRLPSVRSQCPQNRRGTMTSVI